MTAAEHEPEFEPTKNIPYLVFKLKHLWRPNIGVAVMILQNVLISG